MRYQRNLYTAEKYI